MVQKSGKDAYWQKVRGMCISAVIMIHVLASYMLRNDNIHDGMLLFRQFINFPVPLFIFLSGYFASNKKVNNVKEFFKNRGGAFINSLFYMEFNILRYSWKTKGT